jgi:hypothetical protein
MDIKMIPQSIPSRNNGIERSIDEDFELVPRAFSLANRRTPSKDWMFRSEENLMECIDLSFCG